MHELVAGSIQGIDHGKQGRVRDDRVSWLSRTQGVGRAGLDSSKLSECSG